MKMYKVLDTKMNREFKPELIGYSFEGTLSGEYVILNVNDSNVTILAENIEVLENENLINKSMLTDTCKYEVASETKDGLRILIGTEYIRNFEGVYNKRIMHVVIYNFNSKEVIYKTGNNLRLNYEEMLSYLQCELNQWINENVNNSYNLNNILDKILYNFDRTIIKNIAKEQISRLDAQLKQDKENKLREENKVLETELIQVTQDRNVFLIDAYTTLYLISFDDKEVFNHYNNKDGKKFLYDVLLGSDKDNNKELYNWLVDKAGMYIFAEYDNNNHVKCHNENLKDAIAYITNNINIPVVNDIIDNKAVEIKKRIKSQVIKYFVQDKNIKNESLINKEIDNIINISKHIRSKLQYKNGVYYSVNELFEGLELKDSYYKYFIMDALKELDIEYFDNNSLYRVCS